MPSDRRDRHERFVIVRRTLAVSVVVAIVPWMYAAFGIDDSPPPSQVLAVILFLIATAWGTLKWPGLPTFGLALGAVGAPVAIIFVVRSDRLIALGFVPLVAVVLVSFGWIYSSGWSLGKTAFDGRRAAGLGLMFMIPAWLVPCKFLIDTIASIVGTPFSNGEQAALILAVLVGTGYAIALVVRPTDRMIVVAVLVGLALLFVTIVAWNRMIIRGEQLAIVTILLATTSEITLALFVPWQSIKDRTWKKNRNRNTTTGF
jgi:hypothetical protein